MKTCLACAGEISPNGKSASQLAKQRYCSKACAASVNRPWLKSRRNQTQPRHYKKCPICGVSFQSPPTVRTVTCSKRCSGLKRSREQRGELSHRWKGGKTAPIVLLRTSAEYGAWRTAVFERDGYVCALCGQRGGKLAAHHIKPFRDHEALRLAVPNGITLCWPCHRSIHHREHEYEAQFAACTGLAQTEAA